MRSLLPAQPGEPDLDTVYAPPRPHWVRANFIASADGAVSVDGLSRGLQVPGDSLVFAALRGHADVVLVGAGTAKAEGYRPARVSAQRRARRLAAGQLAVPPIAVVTASGDPQLPASFYDAEQPPLVITSAAAARDIAGAQVLACGEREVDLAVAVDQLTGRGLGQVLCEGGPHLFGTLLAAGRLDELCLTVAPLLAGPESGRIVAGPPAPATGLLLDGVLESDGALFLRYRTAPR